MNAGSEDIHVHFENVIHLSQPAVNVVTLILVLGGEARLTIGGEEDSEMPTGSVQFLIRNTPWELKGAKDNMVVFIDVSPVWLLKQSIDPEGCEFFIDGATAHSYAIQIAEAIKDIAALWIKKNTETWRQEINQILLNVFCILVQNFKIETSSSSFSGSKRIHAVTSWLDEHYRDHVSLQQVADNFHVTTSHLSRQFTREVGMSFRDWLTKVRFHHASDEIALTTKTIAQVIEDNGFPSVKRFTKMFREQYDSSPREYREDVRLGKRKHHETATPLASKIQDFRPVNSVEFFSLLSYRSADYPPPASHQNALKVVDIKLQKGGVVKSLKKLRHVIAVGSFDELLKQHVQDQLRTLKKRVSTIEVEIDDPLLKPFLKESFATGIPTPTWSIWTDPDLAIHFLKSLEIPLVVRLTPFRSPLGSVEYAGRLINFLEHNVMLLGSDYVRKWSFVVDLFHERTIHQEVLIPRGKELFDLIDAQLPGSLKGLAWGRDAFPVDGLPAFFSRELVQHVDFIAVSVAPNAEYDFESDPERAPRDNEVLLRQQLETVIDQFKARGIHTPLYLQSWSTVTGGTLLTNAQFFRGALLMEALLSLPEEVSMLGFWLNSEFRGEEGSDKIVNANSLSLFFVGVTKRPIFHILALKERIGEEVLSYGRDWIATERNNVYSILLFNTVTINPSIALQENLLGDYRKCYSIRINAQSKGIWRFKKWIFDQQNGALSYQYNLHPTIYDRDEETMEYLNQRSEPTLSVRDEVVKQFWAEDVVLSINAVCLVEFIRIKDTATAP